MQWPDYNKTNISEGPEKTGSHPVAGQRLHSGEKQCHHDHGGEGHSDNDHGH